MTARARRIPDAAGLQQEAFVALGGLRAVLLQLAHPAVGHGVAEHSAFARDPLARLLATLEYVYAVADGDPALVSAVARRVGARHRSVRSAPGAATAYDARDPELQRFVAATIHDSAVVMAERAWGPLPPALEAELLVRTGRIATALGVPAERWPATVAAFRARWADDLAALRFDDVTAGVARELLAPRHAPRWIRLGMPLLAGATAPTLPPSLAAALGLRVDALPARVAAALITVLLPVYRALPAALRRLPAGRVLAAARASSPVGTPA